jgi:ligand-binding sensor domain-containing protein
MLKRIVALTIFLALVAVAFSQQTGTGQWRVHLPYRKTANIAETPRYVYTWSSFGFYRYDKEVGGSERLSKIQGFSDAAISTIKYNTAKDLLLIAYQDANLDLVRNGQIININDIQRATVNGLKNITNIVFEGDYAYLACTFGIVVLDVEKLEITASYKDLGFGDINDVVLFNTILYTATNTGIYRVNGQNPNDPASWELFDGGATQFLHVVNNKLFSVRPTGIRYFDGTWNAIAGADTYNSIFSINNKLYIAKKDTLLIIEPNLALTKKFINTLKTAIASADGSIWYTTDNAGTLQLKPNGELVFTIPNGPYSTAMGLMGNVDDEVIVAGGRINSTFGFTFSLNGYYRYKNEQWINSLENPNPAVDTLYDFYAIATNPKNNDVWIGAYWQALVRLRNGAVMDVYTQQNSKLKFSIQNVLAGMTLDKSGNLWMCNYGADSALVVRTADGQWGAMPLGNVHNVTQIVVDDKNRKWMVAPRNNGFGLLVYDDNKTPLNPNDDFGPKLLSSNVGSGNLPDNVVNCIAKDRDGEIWIGTVKGPAVFSNPSNILSDKPSDARRIVIGEGTDIGYLLGNEVINCIYIDGGNRKWMGTNNGAWLVSADGQKILKNFNTENSPIFSNTVLQITVNEKTGEVFFGTDLGMISFKGDATAAEETHGNVLVYPNPVRENFEGDLSIRGLAQDANVKITDIAGNLIYETVANGGMATWNMRSFNGRKASTGVYLIFSGTDDASDTYVAKVLVINGGQ